MRHLINHMSDTIKHILDAGSGVAIVLSFIQAFTPMLNFIAVVLAVIWGYYRIVDMKLSNEIKRKQLKEYDK